MAILAGHPHSRIERTVVDLPLDAPPAIVINVCVRGAQLESMKNAGRRSSRSLGHQHLTMHWASILGAGFNFTKSTNEIARSPVSREPGQSFSERRLSWVCSFVESTSMTSAMAFRRFSRSLCVANC